MTTTDTLGNLHDVAGRFASKPATPPSTALVDEGADVVAASTPHRFTRSDGADVCQVNGVLHSVDGKPALVLPNGTRGWYAFGRPHRDDDLPAFEFGDGGKAWYRHGRAHRDEGPAVIWPDGSHEFWRDGEMLPQG